MEIPIAYKDLNLKLMRCSFRVPYELTWTKLNYIVLERADKAMTNIYFSTYIDPHLLNLKLDLTDGWIIRPPVGPYISFHKTFCLEQILGM